MTGKLSPLEALIRLLEGNARYRAARALHPHQDAHWRTSLTARQEPFAAILGCSDSRVPPQLVFDQGLGDLFTTRVAGNVLGDAVLASLEYSVLVLGVSLIVVLGHSGCGAVATAVAHSQDPSPLPGHLSTLVDAVAPAVAQARGLPGDLLDNAVQANARFVAGGLAAEAVLAEALSAGRLALVSAVYDLASGRVSLKHAVGLGVPLASLEQDFNMDTFV